jgi:hypothetical protein
MKEAFFGYYAPSSKEYEVLWNEATIIPDSNVLLDLYRLPVTAREEFIATLETLKERLWVPYQVALEFQRNRLTVISSERKATETALASAKALVGELKQKVEALQIDQYGLGLETHHLIKDLEEANTKLIDAITAVHQRQPDIASSDPIRERLDQILCGRVGPGPVTQADLDILIEGADERFADKIPPGYEDEDKDKNPAFATFFHDQIKYQRKFGDLILWRQIINYVNKQGIKSVLLVTAERKQDWWWREQGKTIGVQPELVREIRRLGNIDLFWMYSSVQFLEHAKTYAKADVSDQAVAELQEVSETPRRDLEAWGALEGLVHESPPRAVGPVDFQETAAALYKWLRQTYGEVHQTDGFPDFIVDRDGNLLGFELKFARNFGRMAFPPQVVNSILRGYFEVNEGRLSRFTMVVAISPEDFDSIQNDNRADELRRRVSQLLRRYPIYGIIVGRLSSAGDFEPLIYQRSHDLSDMPRW